MKIGSNKDKLEPVAMTDIERLTYDYSLFIKHFDCWIHAILKEETADGQNGRGKENAQKRIEKSFNTAMQSSRDFYMEIAKLTKKQGYDAEAERYELIAKIYASFLH